MTRNRITQLVALVALVVFLAGASLLIKPINTQRQELQLDVGIAANTSAVPPHIILQTAALGSFRGLLVDFLWYRVNELKEQGKYYEINTLSQYITTLQPRFPQVWAFHAWNMAYNISVTTQTPQERWSWVNNGVRLLRDQGIPLNPKAVRLYRELSWIFFHKIGQFSDDMHWYYKEQLAREWEELLGTPNPDATTEQILARFRLVAEAPPTLAGVGASSPEAARMLQILNDAQIKPDRELLMQINRLLMLRFSYDARILGIDFDRVPSNLGIKPEVLKLLGDPQYTQALTVLVSHLRKRALIDDYHMQPEKMMEIMEEFGPIDWRHPAAHGQYWSTLGTEMYDELRNPTDTDLVNTYRQKLHSFQDLTRSGRVSFDPISGAIDLLPDPRFIPAYDKAFTDAIAMAERTGQINVEMSYGPGHENFLLMATMYSYLYGDTKEAEKYYLRAKERYQDEPANKFNNRYKGTVQDLVLAEFVDTGDMLSSTRQFIDAMMVNGMRIGLYNYNPRQFNHMINLAKQAYDRFHKDKVATPLATQGRMTLPSFEEMLVQSYAAQLRKGDVSVLWKARVWANTPTPLKRGAYTSLRTYLNEQAMAAGMDPQRVFPTPDGWVAPQEGDARVLQDEGKMQKPTDVQVERK